MSFVIYPSDALGFNTRTRDILDKCDQVGTQNAKLIAGEPLAKAPPVKRPRRARPTFIMPEPPRRPERKMRKPWGTPDPILYEFDGTPARRIQAIVARVYGIPDGAMISPRRGRIWAWPRQSAMMLARDLMPELSLPAIGRRFGNRDHTTVMHAIEAVTARLAKEDDPLVDEWKERHNIARKLCLAAFETEPQP